MVTYEEKIKSFRDIKNKKDMDTLTVWKIIKENDWIKDDWEFFKLLFLTLCVIPQGVEKRRALECNITGGIKQ